MRHFQDELDRLKSSLVGMAGLAEEAVVTAGGDHRRPGDLVAGTHLRTIVDDGVAVPLGAHGCAPHACGVHARWIQR